MDNLKTILIVDDEPILRNGIRFLCDWEKYGYIIIGEASNGLEALDFIQKIKPNIAFIDIIMPIMDGIELTEQLVKNYSGIHIIVLSSYDDFKYVKNLFKLGITDYLLKPTLTANELLETLDSLNIKSSKLQHQNASQILVNNIITHNANHQVILSSFNKAGINFNRDFPFRIILGKIQRQTLQNKFDLDELEIFDSIFSIPLVSAFYPPNYFILLIQDISNETEDSASLEQMINYLSDLLYKQFSIKTIFTYCHLFTSLESISSIYNTLNSRLEYSFYYPNISILNSIPQNSKNIEFPEDIFQNKLDQLLIDDLFHILIDYNTNISRLSVIDIYTLKKQIESKLYQIFNILNQLSSDDSKLDKKKIYFFKLIDTSENYIILNDILHDIYQYSISVLATVKKDRDWDFYSKIKSYIMDHCHNDLKLSDVADAFHLNYSYLSIRFYKHYNEHFSDYLSKIRIEKAKKLLLSTNFTMQEISESCGFSNQGYFSKIFKKYTKITPTEYQKKYLL